jgi:hypothetical protein
MGAAENAFYNSLWQQAAAQGISVFVSTGDSGAAGCDATSSATAARGGLAVSGLSTTPFNTAVGGTQFNEGGNDATFWSVTNGTGLVSVQGYIPEVVWNQSCDPTLASSPCAGQGFFLVGGGGGASILYPKPVWQSGLFGIPNDSARDVPDVSLSAATHDGYIICFNNSCNGGQVFIIGGTSASSPSFAGIMAIIDQKLGRQGLANYTLYRLAIATSARCSSNARTSPSAPPPAGCIFNDVTVGNNSVPGLTGFSATTDFDLATGLGSVNAANLVTAWGAISHGATATTLSASGGAVSGTHGQPVVLTINVTGPSAPAPSGTASLFSSTAGPVGAVALTAPANSNVASFGGSVSNLPGGIYSLTAHYPGDAQVGPSDSNAVSVNIAPETSTVVLRAFGVTAQGEPVQTASFPYGSFMDLHAEVAGASGQGIPTGTITNLDTTTPTALGTASLNGKGEAEIFIFPRNQIPAPLTLGLHAVTATYGGDKSFIALAPGSLNVTITKGNPSLTVIPEAQFVANQSSFMNVFVVATGPIPVTGSVQFFDGTVPLGPPATVDSGQAPVSVTFAQEGQHPITASYSGDATYNATVSPVLSLNVAPPFAFFGGNSATVAAGQTATFNLTVVTSVIPSSFNGTVSLACSGAPAGVTCNIAPNSVALSPTTTSVPITVTVATTTSARLHTFPFRGLPVVFAAVVAVFVSRKTRNRKQRWQVMWVAALLVSVSSCGGGGGGSVPAPPPPPPPPTHATLVVTATSGTHTNTTSLNLTITH